MSKQVNQSSHDYSEKNIPRLTPREHIRKRPGMYIGGTGKEALHQMLWDVVDDAISEFARDKMGQITISLLPSKTVRISDNGQGIPVEIYEEVDISWLEVYCTNIGRWSGKRKDLQSKYRPQNSLLGTGIPAINALSSFCEVEVLRDGYLWRQSYHEGIVISPVEEIRPLAKGEGTGTSITFRPDFTVMDDNEFDFEKIAKRSQELAYLLPKLKIILEDKRETIRTEVYHYPQGLIEALKIPSEYTSPTSDVYAINYDCPIMDNANQIYIVQVQIAFQWFDFEETVICSFANTVETSDEGYHVDAMKAAIQKQSGIAWRYWKQGFIGLVHVWHPYPQYTGSFPKRLINADAFTAVEEAIEAIFAANPEAKAAIQGLFK